MADSPFVGPTYPLRSLPASVQQTTNMSPVQIEVANERHKWVFKDTPGLVPVEIRLPSTYYTSWPYPIFHEETLNANSAEPRAGQLWVPPIEYLDADHAVPMSGTLGTVLHPYSQPAEELDQDHAVPVSGTLVDALEVYTPPPTEINADSAEPVSGTLVVQLITYSNWPADTLDADHATPVSGTLA